MSVGISQKNIVGQFIIEGLIILFMASILSVGIAAAASNQIGNQILSGINKGEKSKLERQEEAREKLDKGEFVSEEEYMSLVNQLTVVTEVEAPNEITCNLTIPIVLMTVLLLVVILVAVTVLSSREVLKMRPKDILASVW